MPIGVLTSSVAVLAGGVIGGIISNKFPKKLAEVLPNIFGLSGITMGISFIMKMTNLSPIILAMIIGTSIGELLNLEDRLYGSLVSLQRKIKTNLEENKLDMLVSMIVIFCFSGTGFFGAITEGISGDPSILIAKSILDFFTAIIFGVSIGGILGLVAIPQCIIMMAVYYGSTFIAAYVNNAMLADFKACGGVITIAIGIKLLKIKQMRVFNMIPALVLVLIFSAIWSCLF